ncbi:uncharacterized protein LOC117815251 [Xyrichtys novacula]|uniref:Uncharacterized protein LOC117815251 n=1 Tax=Xyrichtys novacula TaxID=13765 RepID=A0AAV1EWY0_XYRNO|nr:uncharacterized protein LOC117815251 [Xyrichtys novacula]
MDTESLQSSDRRRGRCLDIFLVVSNIFLFVALIAVAAGGVMCVIELRSKIETSRPPVLGNPSKSKGDPLYQTYKMNNFAYLETRSDSLRTGPMFFKSVPYGEGTSVGSNFVFDGERSLLASKQGTYFIYIELNIICSHICSAGVLSVSVGDKLTCKVELPERLTEGPTPVSKRCWTVTQLSNDKLSTRMTVSDTGLKNWTMEPKGSGLGMFLVD